VSGLRAGCPGMENETGRGGDKGSEREGKQRRKGRRVLPQ